jgi:hypothetical protein
MTAAGSSNRPGIAMWWSVWMAQPAKGYAWIIVEQKPPHSRGDPPPRRRHLLMHGHRLNQKAFATFARCVKENQWPSSWSDSVEDLTCRPSPCSGWKKTA